ncbi:hypothetical protein HAX54_022513 [Datura stramonium]|uniref:Uncharacterized protein n=1 Tax=Datura stramonium TaxID=4076 RepID=A0ABS8UUS3_DATST|nr:hypothetical protein [Datura stramonium]
MQLRSFTTFFKYHHDILPDSVVKIRKKAQWIARMLHQIFDGIPGLPSLEYLQLRSPDFFQSKEWCLGDITFHKLKVLKLVELDISSKSTDRVDRIVSSRLLQWSLLCRGRNSVFPRILGHEAARVEEQASIMSKHDQVARNEKLPSV